MPSKEDLHELAETLYDEVALAFDHPTSHEHPDQHLMDIIEQAVTEELKRLKQEEPINGHDRP